ncbi:hypothetical protein COCMIDRAFT_26216 [Bipolaris oryzae ATCC 44560]|uniref:Uncharacterized protein n=1 Tax=Bipolaris oryzae ATCC 44560 TaxID=930090 RepID=W6ZPX9_COCMI|nr:uncharacterized protein COCMIDRAFT_26216 [Bipolaris oryzae ATCC 44560]EUC45666.1 hypothetical protein COCMIDRAFT_26216 [Bipolaris oryzae ATCC 44560]
MAEPQDPTACQGVAVVWGVADHALATVRHHVRCTSYPFKFDKGPLFGTGPNAETAKRKGRWGNSLLRNRGGMNSVRDAENSTREPFGRRSVIMSPLSFFT